MRKINRVDLIRLLENKYLLTPSQIVQFLEECKKCEKKVNHPMLGSERIMVSVKYEGGNWFYEECGESSEVQVNEEKAQSGGGFWRFLVSCIAGFMAGKAIGSAVTGEPMFKKKEEEKKPKMTYWGWEDK